MILRRALPPLLLLALVAGPGTAAPQAKLTAEEFEAYTTGKVLTYGVAGTAYGIEQYLPGRKVIWAFVGDECRTGSWYEQGDLICFLYEDRVDDPQCWSFFLGAGGLSAQFLGDETLGEFVEVQQSSGPMPCPGPDLGV